MGLFNRKSPEERQEDAMRTAEKIGQGKGFTGRMTKAMMGSEFTDRVGAAMSTAREGQAAAAAMAQGANARTASVLQVVDTGQSINDNPVVELSLDLDGQQIGMRTMVSRIQVPRVGDRVFLLDNPAGGDLLYGGLAAGA